MFTFRARKNFRNDIYKEYKANRHDTPEDLIPQFDYIRKAVEAFNIPSVELLNYEADDLIATYKEQASKKGIKVTIISSDKDLMQLVDDNTFMFDSMKDHFIGKEEVKEKFGVYPDKVIDVQSLAGDSSDNIPGVPGIGVKTAAELINEYGSLENLLDNAASIKQPKRRQSLLDNKDKAFMSKQLVTLKRDVPIKNTLDEFVLKPINADKILQFLKEMEFTRLFNRLEADYGKFSDETSTTLENIKKSEDKNIDHPSAPKKYKKNFSLILNIQELKDLLLKRVNPETIQRQKEILTRLLESENAVMKRGFEEKRESQSAKDEQKGNQIRFDEYKKAKWNELELIKSIDPSLQLYYKQRSDKYLSQ